MRSVWPTAFSTEPLCAQLTPSSAIGARRERRHPAGVTVAQKRATVLDPLENGIGGRPQELGSGVSTAEVIRARGRSAPTGRSNTLSRSPGIIDRSQSLPVSD